MGFVPQVTGNKIERKAKENVGANKIERKAKENVGATLKI